MIYLFTLLLTCFVIHNVKIRIWIVHCTFALLPDTRALNTVCLFSNTWDKNWFIYVTCVIIKIYTISTIIRNINTYDAKRSPTWILTKMSCCKVVNNVFIAAQNTCIILEHKFTTRSYSTDIREYTIWGSNNQRRWVDYKYNRDVFL